MISILYALNGPMYKGGTEAVVLSYFNHIDRNRFKIDFLIHGDEEACKNNPIHRKVIDEGATIYYVTPRGKSYHKNSIELTMFFKEHHYDIVHSHMDSAGYFVLKKAKKVAGAVCISHSHNTSGRVINGNKVRSAIYSVIHEYIRRNLPKYTDIRIACSTEAGEWLFGGKQFILLHNAIDVDKYKYNLNVRNHFREVFGINNDTYVIGHVGRFSEQKNHVFLIELFAEYIKKEPNSYLFLAGEGHLESIIRDKVKVLGINEKVVFLGLRNDIDKIMQMFDLFILPSHHEGLPVVGVEAQASGLPCLVSDTVSHELKLSESVYFCGLSASIEEWISMIDKIKKTDINREKGKEIVLAGGYGIHDIIVQLEELYTEAVSKKV